MARSYIILVNWNGHRDTIECLESLTRLEDGDFRVIIVDNGSIDNSVEHLRSWSISPERPRPTSLIWRDLPISRRHETTLQVLAARDLPCALPDARRVTVIEAAENLGFAGANNVGLAFAARDPDAQYLWVLNNDTVVSPEALSALITHADTYRTQSIIGAVLLYYHNPEIVQGLGGWTNPRKAISGHIGAGSALTDLPTAAAIQSNLAYVMGASMFVRRAIYDVIGGMSEEYFLYCEELDWAMRLPAGCELGICLNAIVFHKEGGSIGTSSVDRPSDTSRYYLYASGMRFYWRHQRRYAAIQLARIVYDLACQYSKRDFAAARAIVQALTDVVAKRTRRGPFGSDEFRRSGLKRNRPPRDQTFQDKRGW